jgi:hypothetical protein
LNLITVLLQKSDISSAVIDPYLRLNSEQTENFLSGKCIRESVGQCTVTSQTHSYDETPKKKDVDLTGINTSAKEQQHVVTHTIHEHEIVVSIDGWIKRTHFLTKSFIHKKKIKMFLLVFS